MICRQNAVTDGQRLALTSHVCGVSEGAAVAQLHNKCGKRTSSADEERDIVTVR